MDKCGSILMLKGAYCECDLEKGHVVQEALPYESIESKHSMQGIGTDMKGKTTYFVIKWD